MLCKEKLILRWEHPLIIKIFGMSRLTLLKRVMVMKGGLICLIFGHFYLTNEHGQNLE